MTENIICLIAILNSGQASYKPNLPSVDYHTEKKEKRHQPLYNPEHEMRNLSKNSCSCFFMGRGGDVMITDAQLLPQ